MKINDVVFNVELEDVLNELQRQLHANNIPLLNKMKDTAGNIMITCPYHSNGQERRPSAGIKKSDGTFHCFACGETHTLPEVISHCFGKDDIGTFGWNWLLKNFLTVRVEERKDVELDFNRNSNVNKRNSGYDIGSNDFVSDGELDGYRYIHPYMYERRLTDEIIELFDIGYDRETQCLTFPVRDIYGNCLFVARRSVNTKYFNYPAGVEKPLYGLYELNKTFPAYKNMYHTEDGMRVRYMPDVIVCESMLDALTCWVYGKYAVALNGLGDELQFKQLRELPCRKLVLATDNDEAGMRARKRIRENIHKRKIITEYILPEGRKDINELTRAEFENLREVF